jgi:hypothetical protein
MRKIIQYFSKLSPLALFALLSNVITQMTGNLNFTTPAVPLLTMEAARDLLASLIDKARNGSRQDKMLRDDQVKVVREILRKQANYVTLVADGNGTILESSGFDLAKVPAPVEQVGQPTNVAAFPTNFAKEVELRLKGVHGAHIYKVYQSTVDPTTGNAEWKFILETTRTRTIITGLESFKPYWFCVSAVGVNGEGLKSDVVLGRAA